MKISSAKTKSMTISTESFTRKLAIEDITIIDQVMCFDYTLLRVIGEFLAMVISKKKWDNKTATISLNLKHVIWKNKDQSIECKTRIYKTCLRTVMSYTAETRQCLNQKADENNWHANLPCHIRLHIMGQTDKWPYHEEICDIDKYRTDQSG